MDPWLVALAATVGERIREEVLDGDWTLPDFSVSRGASGLAMFFGALHKWDPAKGWDRCAHRSLLAAVQIFSETDRPPFGLFDGIAGLAFAARYVAGTSRNYTGLLADLDDILLEHVSGILREDALSAVHSTRGIDLISGASGIGVYLSSFGPQAARREGARNLADYIARVFLDMGEGAGWPTYPAYIRHDRLREQFPDGFFDCGVAHGQPGVLGYLSIAETSTYTQAAIASGLTWLSECAIADNAGINWPVGKGIAGFADSTSIPSRAGWCYGAPGIARVLDLAGTTLKNGRATELAKEAISAVCRRSQKLRRIDSPILCHGLSGLGVICLAFAKGGALSGEMKAELVEIAQAVGRHFDPGSRFGFCDLRAGQSVDDPALLVGAAGVGAFLLFAGVGLDPDFGRMFLIN